MDSRDELRREATEKLRASATVLDEMTPEDIRHLVNELQIHQAELEIQNQELLRTQAELEGSRQNYADLYGKYLDLYDFAPVGYCTLEKDGTIQKINQTAAEQLGRTRDLLLNTQFYHYIVEEDRDTLFLHLRKTVETQTRQTCELRVIKQGGPPFYAHLESIGVQDIEDESRHCRTTITDITGRKQAEEQLKASLATKTILLNEIHHRTRNNMQVMTALLQFQSEYIEDAQILQFFKETEDRINAMALVHKKLHQLDLTTVVLKEYIEDIAPKLLENYQTGYDSISLTFDVEPVPVSIDFAVPFGLLLNELLSNALKHAFPNGRDGEITLSLHTTAQGDIEFRVRDNGVGLPDDLDIRTANSLGFQLVSMIAENQLQGTFKLPKKECGTDVVILFKKPRFEKRI